MTKEEIILQEIADTEMVYQKNVPCRYQGDVNTMIRLADMFASKTVVNPQKLAKFLAKVLKVKVEDIVE